MIKDFLNLIQNTFYPANKKAYPNLLMRLGEWNSLKISQPSTGNISD